MQAFAERNHINGKKHAEGMNAGGGPYKKAAPGIEPPLPYKTNQSREGRVGDRQSGSDRRSPGDVPEDHTWAKTTDLPRGKDSTGLSHIPRQASEMWERPGLRID